MAETSTESCANCCYTRKIEIVRADNRAVSRRTAPICAHDPPQNIDGHASWPEIEPAYWCGKWSADGSVVRGAGSPVAARALAIKPEIKPSQSGLDNPKT